MNIIEDGESTNTEEIQNASQLDEPAAFGVQVQCPAAKIPWTRLSKTKKISEYRP